jgi:chromosome segregation ATPase
MADLDGLSIPIRADASQFTTTIKDVRNALRLTSSDITSRLNPALDQIKSAMLAGVPATTTLTAAHSAMTTEMFRVKTAQQTLKKANEDAAAATKKVTKATDALTTAQASGNAATIAAARSRLAAARTAEAAATTAQKTAQNDFNAVMTAALPAIDALNREAERAADLEKALKDARETSQTGLAAYTKQISLQNELLHTGTITAAEHAAVIEAARQAYAGSHSAANDYRKKIDDLNEQLAILSTY